MKDKISKNKELVKLREKKLTNSISLYLDIYSNGKRNYEFLKLYLVDPKDKNSRERNKETLKLANAIKAQRLLDIQNESHGMLNSYNLDTNLINYFSQLTEDRKASKGNYGNWASSLSHLKRYCPASTTLKAVDINFVEGFKKYLQNKARTKSDYPLAQNSQASYFNKLKACLHQAFDDRIIRENPASHVKGIKQLNPERQYLTLEKIRLLAHTDCKRKVIKRAYLFSCLTGMRWSDINKLSWNEVHQHGENHRIIFRQKKTKGLEYLDINQQAYKLLEVKPK